MPFPSSHPSLERALAERGYAEPTPVQAAVLQPEARGRDLLVSAQTGSGKTVAFGLAIASTLLGSGGRSAPEQRDAGSEVAEPTADALPAAEAPPGADAPLAADVPPEVERLGPPGRPLALVVAPTRELALQVHRELIWLYGPAGARVASCVGGMDVRREARALADGCHIVVGTPGRLRDHLERGRLDPSQMRAVVLDEADEMLDLGFREDLGFILDATPKERRTLLFSATIPRGIATLARQYQRNALRIDTLVANQPHGDIDYQAVRVAPNEVEHAVVNVLRFFEARGALVFCHTREAVRHLHASLQERGFSAVALSGELTQSERSHALQALRDGRARVCVATDVAARGIDLPDLGLVLHADLPGDPDTLLHRSGRTGRAGRKGVCVVLVPYTRRRRAEGLLASAGVHAAWRGAPTAEEIRARDQERLLADPVFSEEATEEDLATARALLAQHSAEEVASALVRSMRAKLPAPEEVFAPDRDERPGRYERPGPSEGRGPGEGRGPRERNVGPEGRARREDDAFRRDASGRDASDDEAPRGGGMVWFRMSVGRRNNADPRWLVPIICRLGHVTKAEIGTIRIFDRETKFEIVAASAQKFAAATRRRNDEDIQIEPSPVQHKSRPARPIAAPRPDKEAGRGPGKAPGKGPGKKPGKKPEKTKAQRS